ncbi:MAG TPA: DUF4149 domain-containing protein [Thermoanaerobaculia bacterium]|nr:DUF4149 domain-containing protein [Thermoanaerobaculia bacterium]
MRRNLLEAPAILLHLLAIALVIGPAVFFGAVVAPQSFHLLPTRDMAGALQAPILTQLCWIAEGGFLLLIATSWWLTRDGASKLLKMLMTRAAFLGLIAAVVIEKLLVTQIDKIRKDAPGLIDSLPAADPARILLGRLHRLSTGFFSIEIAAGVLVLVTTARWIANRRPAPAAPAVPGSSRPPVPPVPKVLDLSGV